MRRRHYRNLIVYAAPDSGCSYQACTAQEGHGRIVFDRWSGRTSLRFREQAYNWILCRGVEPGQYRLSTGRSNDSTCDVWLVARCSGSKRSPAALEVGVRKQFKTPTATPSAHRSLCHRESLSRRMRNQVWDTRGCRDNRGRFVPVDIASFGSRFASGKTQSRVGLGRLLWPTDRGSGIRRCRCCYVCEMDLGHDRNSWRICQDLDRIAKTSE